MKYIIQFTIIVGFSFAGEVLHAVLPLPVPANIYGIILLFLALQFKLLRIERIRETGMFLISIMPILFIPTSVGIIDTWSSVKNCWIKAVIICIVSTILVMGVSALVTQIVIKAQKKHTLKKDKNLTEN